ncbi:MAG: hypothetical protein KDB60_16815 [Propionibacteriaceae bacterium]|nr:hypothetical protein [Propionibacteriaceae bacterium]
MTIFLEGAANIAANELAVELGRPVSHEESTARLASQPGWIQARRMVFALIGRSS